MIVCGQKSSWRCLKRLFLFSLGRSEFQRPQIHGQPRRGRGRQKRFASRKEEQRTRNEADDSVRDLFAGTRHYSVLCRSSHHGQIPGLAPDEEVQQTE